MIPVAVLGATGVVGQTLTRLLAQHPWFELTAVGASERSVGRSYASAARGHDVALPEAAGRMVVRACDPSEIEAPIVFSALDANAAGEVEAAFAAAGRLVVSNARTFRMEDDVPLVIPELNPAHLALLERQRAIRGWPGAVVTNPNCAATVIALAIAPLHEAFGIRQLVVTTLQAVSGAGYPGTPSFDILGNVIPFIGGGEEEKIERETRKLLGKLRDGVIDPAPFPVSAQVNRVPVEHGHAACISVGLKRRVSAAEAAHAIRQWRGAASGLGLPSAPERPVVLTAAEDRPQPRRDSAAGMGMTVTVGRLREDPVLDLRFVACGHNLIRGAAGAAVLNAELLVERRFRPGQGASEGRSRSTRPSSLSVTA